MYVRTDEYVRIMLGLCKFGDRLEQSPEVVNLYHIYGALEEALEAALRSFTLLACVVCQQFSHWPETFAVPTIVSNAREANAEHPLIESLHFPAAWFLPAGSDSDGIRVSVAAPRSRRVLVPSPGVRPQRCCRTLTSRTRCLEAGLGVGSSGL